MFTDDTEDVTGLAELSDPDEDDSHEFTSDSPADDAGAKYRVVSDDESDSGSNDDDSE